MGYDLYSGNRYMAKLTIPDINAKSHHGEQAEKSTLF